MADTSNPAELVSQPIGYRAPELGHKLALGLAPTIEPLTVLAPGQPPWVNTPLTASYLGGTIFTGFGQAPNANSSAPLLGLKSVGGGAT